MCTPIGVAQVGKQAVKATASVGMFLPKLSISAAKASSIYAVRVSNFMFEDAKSLLTDGALIKETPSELLAQLKAALAKQGTQQAELQAVLAREAALRGTEQDFSLLVQRIIADKEADKEEDAETRECNLAAAFEALDKQEELFAKLTGDYLQEQGVAATQATRLQSLQAELDTAHGLSTSYLQELDICKLQVQSDLDKAAKREQQLHEQLSAAASQLAAAQGQLAAKHNLQDQLTAAQSCLQHQKEQTSSANQACKDALGKASEASKLAEGLQRQVDTVTANLKNEQRLSAAANASHEQTLAKAAETSKLAEELHGRVDSLTKEVVFQQECADKASAKHQEALAEVAAIGQRSDYIVNELQADLSNKSFQFSTSERLRDLAQAAKASKLAEELQSQVDSLKDEVKNQQGLSSAACASHKQTLAKAAETSKLAEELQGRVDSLTKEVAFQQEHADKAISRHEDTLDRNAELKKQNRVLELKIIDEKRTTGNAMYTMHHAKEERKQALAEVDALKRTVQKLQKELANARPGSDWLKGTQLQEMHQLEPSSGGLIAAGHYNTQGLNMVHDKSDADDRADVLSSSSASTGFILSAAQPSEHAEVAEGMAFQKDSRKLPAGPRKPQSGPHATASSSSGSPYAVPRQERQLDAQRKQTGSSDKQGHGPVSTTRHHYNAVAVAQRTAACMAPKWGHDGFDSLQNTRGGHEQRQAEGEQQRGGHEGGLAQRSNSQSGDSRDNSRVAREQRGGPESCTPSQALSRRSQQGNKGGGGERQGEGHQQRGEHAGGQAQRSSSRNNPNSSSREQRGGSVNCNGPHNQSRGAQSGSRGRDEQGQGEGQQQRGGHAGGLAQRSSQTHHCGGAQDHMGGSGNHAGSQQELRNAQSTRDSRGGRRRPTRANRGGRRVEVLPAEP